MKDFNDDFIIKESINYGESLLESLWATGFHRTKDQRLIKISDMDIKHLKNTIKLFSYYDTLPLELELEFKLQINKK